MQIRLPESIDPFQLANNGERLEGSINIKSMGRLAPALHDTVGDIHVVLEFGLDEFRQPMVRGRLTGKLAMVCQRCLEPFQQPIDSRFLLGLVKNEYQMGRLSDEYEPLLVTEVPTALAAIVEDEVLLVLPIVATHLPGTCKLVKLEQRADTTGTVTRPNPFAVLKDLKKT